MKYDDNEDWKDFFLIHDLGVPIAVAIDMGGAHATEKGIEWINESFIGLCEYLDIDSYGEYEDLDSMIRFANE
jgi:hypothetical protein